MAGGRINNNVGWSRSSKLALLGLLLGGDVLAGVASVVAVVGRLLGIPEADGVAGDLLTLDLLALVAFAVVVGVGLGEAGLWAVVGSWGTRGSSVAALEVLVMVVVGGSAHSLGIVLGEGVLAAEQAGQSTAEASSSATWRAAQLEVGEQAGQNDSSQAKDLLEAGNAQDEGQEEQQLQLEDLQHQQQGDDHLLQLLAGCK